MLAVAFPKTVLKRACPDFHWPNRMPISAKQPFLPTTLSGCTPRESLKSPRLVHTEEMERLTNLFFKWTNVLVRNWAKGKGPSVMAAAWRRKSVTVQCRYPSGKARIPSTSWQSKSFPAGRSYTRVLEGFSEGNIGRGDSTSPSISRTMRGATSLVQIAADIMAQP
ncbi:hypothetical protein K490DRAFT_56891 [Saccharata proteae CBS 121410]|uniref:Uncharacterized protein n=1 Tax=Saccharata proteae CBS 121410 TaxID=1314787 RepID=A0A9P4HSM9_9PEZI|nr:hypothetical protein K490DRAFT_56891 [Saccharata proteae CBS 121410]